MEKKEFWEGWIMDLADYEIPDTILCLVYYDHYDSHGTPEEQTDNPKVISQSIGFKVFEDRLYIHLLHFVDNILRKDSKTELHCVLKSAIISQFEFQRKEA
jgi:hypothetical protein